MEEIKMPFWLRDFLLIGIGLTGLHLSIGDIRIEDIKLDLMTIVLVVIFTVVFTYGIISLIKDYKDGGFNTIFKKLNDFFL